MENDKKSQLIFEITSLLERVESLPTHALHGPINHYDLSIVLRLLLVLAELD